MIKIYRVILVVMVAILIVGGTTACSNLLSSNNEVENQNEPVVNSSQNDNQSTNTDNVDDDSDQDDDQGQGEPQLTAILTANTAEVFTCGDCSSSDVCEFILLEQDEITITEGDSIRTGKDGTATLKFNEEIELVLAANTQVRLLKFQATEDGSTQIFIEQLIGEAYFKVNYSNTNNHDYDFRIFTPVAITKESENEQQAFSGISYMHYEQFVGLSPEDLESAIQDTFSTQCGAVCFQNDCSNCLKFGGLTPLDFQVDDLTGELAIEFITSEGIQQANILAGQTFRHHFDGFGSSDTWMILCQAMDNLLNGIIPPTIDIDLIKTDILGVSVYTGPTSNCGDGICDIYQNENGSTCPADCN